MRGAILLAVCKLVHAFSNLSDAAVIIRYILASFIARKQIAQNAFENNLFYFEKNEIKS